MAEIKLIKKSANNSVTTESGSVFYPVTVSKAVYLSADETLDDILFGNYSHETDKSILQWLRELDTRANYFLDIDYFEENYLPTINQQGQLISTLQTLCESLNTNILNVSRNYANVIANLNAKISNFRYDSEPMEGSTNLVPSGGIYAYINKKFNSLQSFYNGLKTVIDLDNYSAIDGETVLYIGPTTETYDHNSLYIYHSGDVSFDSEIDFCHNNFPTNPIVGNPYWEKIITLGGDSNIDLSNYYNKTEVNTLINNINNPNIYFGSDTITIDENNVIHAVIPEQQNVNLNNYYTKQQTDQLIQSASTQYVQGDNIIIEGNRISAIIPAYQQPNLSKYYKSTEVDELINNIHDTTYTAGDNISIDENNVISAVIPEQENQGGEVVAGSNNVSVAKIETTVERVISTTTTNVTTTTTTTQGGQTSTTTESEEIPNPDPVNNPNEISTEVEKTVQYSISVSESVTDVQVDGVSVMDGTVAKIALPKQQSIEFKTLTIKSDKGNNAATLGTFNNSQNVTINFPIEFVTELPQNVDEHTLYLLPVEQQQS